MKTIIVVCFLLRIFFFEYAIAGSDECGSDTRNYCKVSISTLLSAPAFFHGKVIYVMGHAITVEKGPWSGYWVSQNDDHFFSGSAIKLKKNETKTFAIIYFFHPGYF